MEGKIIRRVGQRLAMSFAVLVTCAVVSAQDVRPTTPKPNKQETKPGEAVPEQSLLQFPQSVQPLPKGQIKILTARVIEVKGVVKWQPPKPLDKTKWNRAKVNDVLENGTVIRTLIRSETTLRVGKNATMKISRAGRVHLALMMQDGDVLVTRVGMTHGRCDIKVSQVGVTNDFDVITPTTVLAVGGTGFAVTWGALEGVEIDALATNVINAIEVRYLQSNMNYYLSGSGATRENQPDPVEVAFDRTFAPTMPGGLVESEFLAELQSERRVDYSRIGFERISAFVSGFELPPVQSLPTPPLQHFFTHAPVPSTDKDE